MTGSFHAIASVAVSHSLPPTHASVTVPKQLANPEVFAGREQLRKPLSSGGPAERARIPPTRSNAGAKSYLEKGNTIKLLRTREVGVSNHQRYSREEAHKSEKTYVVGASQRRGRRSRRRCGRASRAAEVLLDHPSIL